MRNKTLKLEKALADPWKMTDPMQKQPLWAGAKGYQRGPHSMAG